MVSYHRLLVLLVCFFSIVSCSSGDIIDQSGSRLVQISTTTTDNYETHTNLHYDHTGKVLIVEDFTQNVKFHIQYDYNRKLKHTSHYLYSPEIINGIDSFIYGQTERLEKVILYRLSSLKLKPTWEINYKYDGSEKPLERKTIQIESGKTTSWQKYFWDKNNLIKIQYFNHENTLVTEIEIQYDKAKNYKKQLPIISNDPITIFPNIARDPIKLCENNFISYKYTFTTDPTQLICNPCVFKYKYNKDKFPVEVILPNGIIEVLVYK